MTHDQEMIIDELAKAKINFYQTLVDIGDLTVSECHDKCEHIVGIISEDKDYESAIRKLSRI